MDAEGKKSKKQSRGHLTYEDRLGIEKLIKDGISTSLIALKLGRSINCIKVEIRRAGVRENYSALKAQESAEGRRERQGNRFCIPFSLEEADMIRRLIAEGKTLNRIVGILGCGKVRFLKYIQKEGMQISKSPLYEKQIHKDLPSSEERLQALEEHVKILTDQIRILNDKNSKN